MSNGKQIDRRRVLGTAAAGIVAAELPFGGVARANAGPTRQVQPMEPIKQITAGVLDIGYYETGTADGPAVLLLHGWPYDIHSYVDVAPLLAARGCRVIVPHLRGHGTTRFLDRATPRSGQQASIGADLIALMDALHVRRAVMAGYDWGGRAACGAAAGRAAGDHRAGDHDGWRRRWRRAGRNVGHNLPQEDPTAFADAVWELASNKH